MMETSTESGRKSLQLSVVRADTPYQTVFLKTKFPTAPEDLPVVSGFVSRLIAAACQGRKMNLETFVQCPPLSEVQQMPRMTDHAREWQPIMGLGIWPDREPPTSLTKADFLKLLPGQRPRIDKYKLCRISAPGKAREQAWTSLLGTGALLVILTTDDSDTFLKKRKTRCCRRLRTRRSATLRFTCHWSSASLSSPQARNSCGRGFAAHHCISGRARRMAEF